MSSKEFKTNIFVRHFVPKPKSTDTSSVLFFDCFTKFQEEALRPPRGPINPFSSKTWIKIRTESIYFS